MSSTATTMQSVRELNALNPPEPQNGLVSREEGTAGGEQAGLDCCLDRVLISVLRSSITPRLPHPRLAAGALPKHSQRPRRYLLCLSRCHLQADVPAPLQPTWPHPAQHPQNLLSKFLLTRGKMDG